VILKSILASTFLFAMFSAAGQNHAVAPMPIPGISPPSIKMGLWEETVTTNSMTSKSRSCVTSQSYQAAFGKMMPGCAISNPTQTSSTIDADVSCSMNGVSSSGHLNVQIADPGTVHTTMTYAAQVNGQSMQGTINTDSHWVSSDCGKIPPGESRDVD
jgi:hypothetical protein